VSSNATAEESTVIMVDATGMPRRRTIAPYDFKRPNKVGRDHARALQLVHETFARQFSTILSSTLRTVSPIHVTSIEQRTYDEYVSPLPTPTSMTILAVDPLPGHGILHLPLPAAMEIVDRLLGGPGGESHPDRPMTEIEIGVLRGLLDRVMRELTYAFESFMDVTTTITGAESNPQFAQIAGLSDMVVVGTYSIAVGERQWEASLTFPFMMLEPALEAYTESKRTRDVDSGELARAAELVHEQLHAAPVELGVSFNTVTLSASEIVSLQAGDVLPLRHRVDAPLTITVGGVPCFTAMPGRNGRRLAAMVTGDLQGRRDLERQLDQPHPTSSSDLDHLEALRDTP
jgi:flagellar motor switch protein FliM